MQYGNLPTMVLRRLGEIMFKSYYVVWKLVNDKRFSALVPCLNRTMQYGNEISSWADIRRDIEFKSYYVVWKPYEVTTANDGRFRLNRTMQYGNSELLAQHEK